MERRIRNIERACTLSNRGKFAVSIGGYGTCKAVMGKGMHDKDEGESMV